MPGLRRKGGRTEGRELGHLVDGIYVCVWHLPVLSTLCLQFQDWSLSNYGRRDDNRVVHSFPVMVYSASLTPDEFSRCLSRCIGLTPTKLGKLVQYSV